MAKLKRYVICSAENVRSTSEDKHMAQYFGSSLTALESPAEKVPPAWVDDSLAVIVGQIVEYQVPPHAIDGLDRLYGSLYACWRFLRLCDPVLPHTWIAYQRGEIVGVLLFRVNAGRVRVLTEMFILDEAIATAFARDVFSRYCDTVEIDFNAIGLTSPFTRMACQHFAFSENYVLTLPASVESYQRSLGKSTRKTLRGYSNRLLRDHPGFEWQCSLSDTLPRHVQRALVQQLQEFKRASMTARGKQAQIDAHETTQLLQMAADCGMFGLGTVNGKLCAGSLALKIGDSYVMMLCAADPAFSAHRLGLLACYWSLCDCIMQGARQCHLLWGRYRYKEQLLAVPISLHRLRMYRSRWHMLFRPMGIACMTVQGLSQRCRAWLRSDMPNRQSRIVRDFFSFLKRPGSTPEATPLQK